MNYNKMIIGIDLDDTVENLIVAWTGWLNKEYGHSVLPSDITDWAFHKFYPSLTTEQVYAPLFIDEFWDTVQVKPDAVEYIEKLYNEGFQLYICTNSNSKTLNNKLEKIVYKHFPYIDSKHIIVTANKQLIKLNVLVDDNPANLTDADYIGILLNCSHNMKFDTVNYNNKLKDKAPILRADDWLKVYNLIHWVCGDINTNI